MAVSRKTPRLIELLVREGIADVDLLSRITTEHGLLRVQGAREINVADDILVKGRTFGYVVDAIRSVNPGARIHQMPFAVATPIGAPPGDFAGPIFRVHHDESIPFVTSEVSAFGALAKPFDTDHPILYMSVRPGCSGSEIEDALLASAQRQGLTSYRVDRRWAPAGGGLLTLPTWTILAGADVPADGRSGTLRKLRCYFEPRNCRVAVAPIAPRVGRLRDLERDLTRTPFLEHMWSYDKLRADLPAANLIVEQALVTWANYLLELADMRPTIEDLSDSLATRVEARGRFTVDPLDVSLVLPQGDPVAVTVELNSRLAQGWQTDMSLDKSEPMTPPDDIAMSKTFRANFEQRAAPAVVQASSQTEALQSVLQAYHSVEETSPDARPRIASGVSLPHMLRLTDRWAEPNEDAQAVNRAMDSLVDSGVAVPRFAFAGPDEDRVWFRAFHAGEPNANVRAALVIHALDSLADRLQPDRPADEPVPVPAFLAEKLMVLLSEHMRLFDAPELRISGGFERRWYLYGARPVVEVARDRIFATDWARTRGLLAKIPGGKYQVIPAAREQWKTTALPLTIRDRISAAAHWVVDAREVDELGNRFLTAIASVESEGSFEQALLAELRGWADSRFSVAPTWESMRRGLRSPKSLMPLEAAALLEKFNKWMQQARSKRRMRQSLPRYIDEANGRWPDERTDPTSSTWHGHLKPALERMSASRGQYLERIESAVGFATVATEILKSLAVEIEAGTAILVAGTFERRVSAFTASVREGGWSEILDDPRGLLRALDRVRAGVEWAEVAESMDIFVAASIKAVHHATDLFGEDQAEVAVQGRTFCLVWDLIGSSTTDMALRLRRSVNEHVARSFGSAIEGFDRSSTDDSNLAVGRDLHIMLRICEDVARLYGRDHPVRFGLAMSSDIAPLIHKLPEQRPTGDVLEVAVRLRDIFRERDIMRWTGDPLSEPSTSYCVFDARVHAFADRWHFNLIDRRLDGVYRPKHRSAVAMSAYLWMPGARRP